MFLIFSLYVPLCSRFFNRIEIKGFEGAKLIANGLVVEGRGKKDIKKHVVEIGTNAELKFSNYPTRKKRDDSGISWADRRGK
jgi:hypothetical protein